MRALQSAAIKSIAALVILLSLAAAGNAQETAPGLELKDQTGATRTLGEYSGKVVVLNFWATWCGPCAKEMPIFVELANKYGEQGVVVLAASLDAPETQQNIAPFIEKQKIPFPVLLGTTVDHMKQFGMGEVLPGTMIIDQQGRIFGRLLGQVRKKELLERVDWLLGVSKAKKAPNPLVKHY